MDNNYNSETEQKILAAARRVITRKGKAGARMQEIANDAGVNKALLHYYFRSKDKLFARILEEVMQKLIQTIFKDADPALPMKQFLENFIINHIDFIDSHMDIMKFFLGEISTNWDEVSRIMKKSFQMGGIPVPMVIVKKINGAIQSGEIRPVDPVHLIINVLSLDIFFFVISPVLMTVLDLSEQRRKQLVDERKEEVFNMVWEHIKIKG